MDFKPDLIIKNPTEHKIEVQKDLKIAFDHVKMAHDTLLDHKLLDQETADTFTSIAKLLLVLGKKMNEKGKDV